MVRMPLTILRLILPFLVLGLFPGCREQVENPIDSSREAYSFFAVGHAYGHYAHADTTDAPYPPFLEVVDQVKKNPGIDFGVLLGDHVTGPAPELYDGMDSILNRLNRPVYIVPGNHDFNWDNFGTPLFGEWDLRYGKRYYPFRYQGDLFFIIDSNSWHWRIMGDMWDMVQAELEDLEGVRNIFFLLHNIIWWDKDPSGVHHYPTPNSTVARHDTSNFWTEVIPRLEQLDQEVYFLAGDAGAFCSGREITYFHEKNYHFISHGLGCRPKDAWLQVIVRENGDVNVLVKPTRHFDRRNGLWIEDYRYR